jgi:predicted NBD/HSP70 family sugar kinase
VKTFVFIHIGHGVGGGLVLDGRLYRGQHGNAGLMGGLYPLELPRPSGQDLIETLQAEGYAVRDFNDLDGLDIAAMPALDRWIARAAGQLKLALNFGGRLIDPEAIIIGGRMPPPLLHALFDAIEVDAAFAASIALPQPRVRVSELGPDAGVIGAASVCMFKIFFEY